MMTRRFVLRVLTLNLSTLPEPRMVNHLVQSHPLPRTDCQAGPDKILALLRYFCSEDEIPTEDVLVTVEGDVPLHQVIQ